MSKIHNTLFNNLANDTSIGNESQLVTNGNLNLKKNSNSFLILSDINTYLGLSQFENNISTLGYIPVVTLLGVNQTIFFGVDTYEFIKYLESLYGLSPDKINVTNRTSLTFIYLPQAAPPRQDIILSSNSSTYNYFKFTAGSSGYSNSYTIFNTFTTSRTLNIIANYSSGVLQSIELG